MALTLRNVLTIAATLPLICAIPTSDISCKPAHIQEASSTCPSTTFSHPLRRIRDAIIERIWTVPKRSGPHPHCDTTTFATPASFKTRYGGDVVLRFKFNTEEEVKALAAAADILYLDIWDSTDQWLDLRVAKDILPSLLGLLPHSLRSAYTPLIHDLAQAVHENYPAPVQKESKFKLDGLTSSDKTGFQSGSVPPRHEPHDIFFDEYQPLKVLEPWLRLLASMFPKHASLISIGKSAEGRDIPALRLGTQTVGVSDHKHTKRDTILITGGSHAREWISVSSVAYVAWSMVTRYGDLRFPYVTKILDHFDLVFVPVINPDGYEYTWTTDRLWRKNRQKTSLPFCPGIDIDRAFSFAWDGNKTVDNPCAENYAGTEPFQSVEALRLAEWAKNETKHNNASFNAFLDLHSYSQSVLWPYSYSCHATPANLEDLEEVAIGLAKSFRITNGHYYGTGSACEGDITVADNSKTRPRVQFSSQGGSALDYFYHDLHVRFAYQIKLRDQGSYGFLLPRSNIIPTGYETYEAVLGMGRWLLGNHGIESIDDPSQVWGSESETTDTNGQKLLHAQDNAQQQKTIEFDDEDEQFELRRRRRR